MTINKFEAKTSKISIFSYGMVFLIYGGKNLCMIIIKISTQSLGHNTVKKIYTGFINLNILMYEYIQNEKDEIAIVINFVNKIVSC